MLEVPEGAYATVPAWSSAANWLGTVEAYFSSPAGLDFLRHHAHSVRLKTLMAVAHADAAAADVATGRNVATSHQSVGRQIRKTAKTVFRARQVLEDAGFSQTVVAGRALTAEERAQAREFHGSRQKYAASVRALTLPRPAADVENVHLPVNAPAALKAPVDRSLLTRDRHRAGRAARNPRHNPAPTTPRFSLAMQQLAWKVAHRYGLATSRPYPGDRGLVLGRHIGAFCALLARHRVTPERYTADTLAVALDKSHADRRTAPLPPERQHSRLGYFSWTLSLLPQDGPTELERRRGETEVRHAELRAQADATRERRRRAADRDQTELDQISAQMNQDIAERNRSNPALRALRASSRLPYLPSTALG